jgi:hypothetical protein
MATRQNVAANDGSAAREGERDMAEVAKILRTRNFTVANNVERRRTAENYFAAAGAAPTSISLALNDLSFS